MKTVALATSAVLLACQGFAYGQRTTPFAEYRADPQVQRATSANKQSQAKRTGPPATLVKLAPPSGAELASMKSNDGRVARIGFARDVHGLSDDGLLARLDWQELPGGARVAHLGITSPDAAALRIGIAPRALPLQAVLRFHDGSGRGVHEFTGEDILESVASNLEAGQKGANGRTWWSPVIESSTAIIEIELPPGPRPADVRMAVPRLSHLVTSAAKGFTLPKSESSCALDAKCHERNFGNEMNAEARMLFTREGVTYACSGTLVADQDASTEIPYFHTASHCISNQADASTIATYWFYRADACNSGTPGRYEVRNGGADLLFSHPETDTTLLRLNAAPPAGAVYMGWNAGPPLQTGTPVTGIHHAGAEVQKVSFGDIAGHASCFRGGGMCRLADAAISSFYYVTWRAGATQGGSSGSPLVADSTRHLVGHLSSGMSSCARDSAGDYYGRFDVAYHAGLNRWLGATAVTVAIPTPVPPPAPRVDSGPRLRLTTTLSSVPRYAEK